MKKLYFLFFLLLTHLAFAQVPQGIPYQAAARNTAGQALVNTSVKVRFSILDSVATGTTVYQETHSTTTNSVGLFNVNVGMGTAVTGTFSVINWGKNAKFMKMELDITGTGASYVDMGTQQMLSVPYALYAGSSQVSNVSVNGLKAHYGFDQSKTWTCPAGVYSIEVELWAGGGGGGGGAAYNGTGSVAGNGGKGGYVKSTISVTPNTIYNITVGQAGTTGSFALNGSGTLTSVNGTDGGNTSFSNLLTAQGGKGGRGFFVNINQNIIQTGLNGQDGPVTNYNVSVLGSRSYIPSGYTVLFPGATAAGGNGAYYYGVGNYGPGTNGEAGYCVISY